MPDTSPTAALRVGLVALLAGFLAPPAFGQQGAPAPAPRPANPPQAPRPKAPDPAFEAAQAAFETQPEAARREIQDALAWTGHSSSTVTGAFGRRTYEAIMAFQRAGRADATGVLDAPQREALLSAGRRARESTGFALRRDGATGVAIGVPVKLLPREEKAAQGTRWQSRDGRVTLETRALDDAAGDLQATFDRVSAATPDRKVTYRLKRPDFLVVTGETPTGRFYIRYAATPAGLRGFTLSYDKALAAEIDPVVIAVANSFDQAPTAVTTVARPQAAAPVGPAPSAVSPEGNAARFATGFVVTAGRLLTSAQAVARCPALLIGREAGRLIAADEAAGLALVGFGDAALVRPVPIAAYAVEGDVTGVGTDRAGAVAAIPGTIAGSGRVVAPLQPGAAGAPLFDRQGRLVGMVADYPASPRLVAGLAAPSSYTVVPPSTVSAFFTRQGIAAALETATDAAPLSTGEIVQAFADRVRSISCN